MAECRGRRMRKSGPGCARQSFPAITSQSSTTPINMRDPPTTIRREVSAGSARATFAPIRASRRCGTPAVGPTGAFGGPPCVVRSPMRPPRLASPSATSHRGIYKVQARSGDISGINPSAGMCVSAHNPLTASCPSCRAGGTPGSAFRTGVGWARSCRRCRAPA
jgi:hypothetical protein